MNKTEKLLAARKKLKEFQQHKQSHHYEATPNSRETVQDTDEIQALKMNDTNNRFYVPNVQTTTNIPAPIFNNNQDSKLIENKNEIPPSSIELQPDPIDTIIAENPQKDSSNDNSHSIPKFSSNDFEVFRFPDSNDQSDIFPHPTSSVLNENLGENEAYTQNGPKENSSSLQKQHLLQMATDVANALVETEHDTESTPFHSEIEYRNQFLTTCLEEQKRLVSQLHIQVSQYNSRVSELETLLATKDAEFEAKLLREVNPLKEQLQVHAQTTGILVAEKAELSSAITQYQTIAQKKTEEVAELCEQLKSAHSRIFELEKKHSQIKITADDEQKVYNQMQTDYLQLEKKYTELKRDMEEQHMETAELRQNLNLKNTELSNLQRELQEKKNLLSLAELKIQQLTNTPHEMQALEGQHQAQTVLEQQLSQLRETLKSVNTEKEDTCKHYENYVKQLDFRYEKLVQELDLSKSKMSEYEEREDSFIQRLSAMEQQYQREKQRVESLLHLETHEEKINHLTKSMDSLTLELETLQSIIQEKETEIETLKEELQELKEFREQSVDTSKLVTALEGEQLGASRAVSQNQQLKSQLSEMHDAFVTLSNSKLDLTEKLQGERVIGRKLNAQLNQVEAERDELRKELKRKEAVLDELEKEKLQSAQITDQMQHYQAQSLQARTLQQELQNALSAIENLKKENQLLNISLVHADVSHTGEGIADYQSENLLNGDENSIEIGVDVGGFQKQMTDTEVQTIENDVEPNSLAPESAKKLEERFKQTMEKVAELTDEKQRLEHLVLQLQGETETIGEYITLYQKQRAILHKKAQDREQTFSQLIEQRNQLQVQLHQLKVLVAELLKNQGNDPNSMPTVPSQDESTSSNNLSYESEKNQVPLGNRKNETTSKILDLLTEIKDCKDTCSVEPNFHPCLWCSGKLITV